MANKFKSKGTAILSGAGRRPNSIGDFLQDITDETRKDALLRKTSKPPLDQFSDPQLHASTDPQLLKSIDQGNSSNTGKAALLGRLHIEIRQDLAERLLELVYQRKRNPNIKGKVATQRAIIEEALEQYFINHPPT